MIANYFLLLKVKKRRAKFQAERMIAYARLLKLRMSLRSRHFLHSNALLPCVVNAPWYVMYRNGSDSDLISAISLTRDSFEHLLSRFKLFYVFRSGPGMKGRPPRVKDHHCILSLLLHSYCSPSENKTWSEMFGISPGTLIRTLVKAENALLSTLNSMTEARVEWPSSNDQIRMGFAVEAKEPLIKGRWGFIDGKSYGVQEPRNASIQNGMFVSGTVCFSADGLIVWAKLNFFGSWNDSEISREFEVKLANDDKNVPGHGVLSDSAFPVSGDMFCRIMTPLECGDLERSHPSAQPALVRLSASITSMRQAAEWGMASVCKVYRVLDKRLSHDKESRGRLLTILHKLHNYRVRTTGISQIKTFFNA